MTSDQKNFTIARRINWKANELVDQFRDAASSCHGVRMLFANDNGDLIDFAMLDFNDPLRNTRIYSLLQHQYIPVGFVMRSQNLSGVIYLPQFDRPGLGSWALELLQGAGGPVRGDVVCSQNAFDLQEHLEQREDIRNIEWECFMSYLTSLKDRRAA